MQKMNKHSCPINILVVDDEKSIRRLLEKELASARRCITTAGNGREALIAIRKNVFDVIVLDISLPDANGIELMSRFHEEILGVQIILITGYGDVDDAVEAMKTGACDYITKPFDLGRLEQVIEKAYQIGSLHKKKFLKQQGLHKKKIFPDQIVGHSAAMEEVRFLIGKVAPTSVPVLVTGESGTGKNVVARQLHGLSLRGEYPLITKNCATLQEELIRSELFGYCKGAFTGAEDSRDGLLDLADKGTLFLDEIGELSVGVQASLLRVMENQTFRPVGDKHERKVDIRFVFATNRDLKEEVAKGRFSEALFHRLNVFAIKILPLRKRKEEIPVLMEYFLGQISTGSPPCMVSKNAMKRLMAYDWPGNVRELYNVMERGVILADNNIITERCLPLELLETTEGTEDKNSTLFPTLEELDKNYIMKVLDHVDGNRSKAAEILGISRKTLYRKLLNSEE
ncbi:sigma-54 dependent transcriptional regulator/response regulator [Desulforapulum autotrophicum HRM2]|uniref:Sigma-54 dependent transcriptional regulator/response regulator n=1 Tax=Desulforapulum autotrophicum (strain ATCC 43914 / DSM 3382 / VKM B-1955 / HRM2) TaxID=177437 RepID=C0QA67_DESAH|nr:sigma-54 dependent transcriptional regulator/response regulator [Desulforapulum autotrophicum HRM2]